jgi:MFS family permease
VADAGTARATSTAAAFILIADRQSSVVRKLLLLTSVVVFFDTLFFAALTPLLPHFARSFELGKVGAGLLAAAYPAGAFLGAIPSGIVAGRLGVKPTMIVGLVLVGICTLAFGVSNQAWELDAARFAQGVASAFSWTGALGWLVASSPPKRRGALIGRAFAAAVFGALFGPVIGGVASVAGIGWTFGAVAVASFGLVGWAAAVPAPADDRAHDIGALLRTIGDRRVLAAAWFVVLPALLFGALSVLAPLRLSALGLGAVGIGAVFLCSAALEAGNNLVIGQIFDRAGARRPIVIGLIASIVDAAALPWPDDRFTLAVLVVCGGLAFGTFFTPGMTMVSNLAETRSLPYGYASSLLNLAWAPGQTIGAVGAGAISHETGDAVPYLALSGVCALTLAGLWRTRNSRSLTGRSEAASSSSSSGTTGAV